MRILLKQVLMFADAVEVLSVCGPRKDLHFLITSAVNLRTAGIRSSFLRTLSPLFQERCEESGQTDAVIASGVHIISAGNVFRVDLNEERMHYWLTVTALPGNVTNCLTQIFERVQHAFEEFLQANGIQWITLSRNLSHLLPDEGFGKVHTRPIAVVR